MYHIEIYKLAEKLYDKWKDSLALWSNSKYSNIMNGMQIQYNTQLVQSVSDLPHFKDLDTASREAWTDVAREVYDEFVL